jgi:hypothetical protein
MKTLSPDQMEVLRRDSIKYGLKDGSSRDGELSVNENCRDHWRLASLLPSHHSVAPTGALVMMA